MTNNNILTKDINKHVCNAFNCNNIGTYRIPVVAGLKIIYIDVCEKCLSKFHDSDNRNQKPMI